MKQKVKWPGGLELVFLPGLDGTGISFEPLSGKMPPGAEVTVISYPTDKLMSFDQLVNLAALQIPVNKDLIILAESFSGPLAVHLLSSRKLQAKGIIFCATFARPPRPLVLQISRFLPLSLIMKLPTPDRIIYWYCRGAQDPGILAAMFRRIRAKVKPRVMAHRIRMLADINVVAELGHFRTPCCYIQASHDRVVPPGNLRDFKENLPGLTVKRVDGPHFILQAKPEECSRIINDFIASVTDN